MIAQLETSPSVARSDNAVRSGSPRGATETSAPRPG